MIVNEKRKENHQKRTSTYLVICDDVRTRVSPIVARSFITTKVERCSPGRRAPDHGPVVGRNVHCGADLLARRSRGMSLGPLAIQRCRLLTPPILDGLCVFPGASSNPPFLPIVAPRKWRTDGARF